MKNFVRYWREKRGLTLEQLAQMSGMSVSQISLIEREDRGWSIESLPELSKALDITPGQLLDSPTMAEEMTIEQKRKRIAYVLAACEVMPDWASHYKKNQMYFDRKAREVLAMLHHAGLDIIETLTTDASTT